MKRLVLPALILATVSALIWGCASDIVLPPKASLKGTYKGEYALTRNFGASNEQRFEQPINWTFDDQSFRMSIDTASPNVGSHSFCKVSGQYAITTGVRMQTLTSVPIGGQFTSCNHDEDPVGTFTIINNGDTLNLTLSEGSDLKEIKLVKVQ